MNKIDKNFYNLVNEIKSLSERELYYRMRKKFDCIPEDTKQSCMKFFNQFLYWGKMDIENNNYEEIELKEQTLFNHIDDFVWLYSNLSDYRSKKTLYAILNNWYKYDFLTTNETREYLYDDYFDLDLVKCSSEEVIVDLGAYTGDTILSYIENYGENCYKKIYAFEITPSVFETLKENLKGYRNIEFINKAISNRTGKITILENKESPSANTLIENENGKIEMTTLDTEIKEKITLIKADIEGCEKEAIEGAKYHIKNDHPKLLFSVYHKNDDLWQIPKMIHNISKEYKFYLRFNSSPIYPTEITLIAI